MNSIKNLHAFASNLESKGKDIKIDELDIEILELLLEGASKKLESLSQKKIKEFRDKYKITVDAEQVQFFFLTSTRLRWNRPEKDGEGYLDGGFVFSGATNIFSAGYKFWEKSVEKFIKNEKEELINNSLLSQLHWFESPTIPTEAEYTPQFGCVKPRKGELPDEFYFYDSGLIYPLPFKSFDEYINALVATGAVSCWQYFYIDPELIISKNNELKYITWSNYNISRLEEGIESIRYKPSIKYDRLDLINEYLERCIRLLPITFSFLDFSYHESYYSAFKKLYDKKRR
jgi:hypothetical protein